MFRKAHVRSVLPPAPGGQRKLSPSRDPRNCLPYTPSLPNPAAQAQAELCGIDSGQRAKVWARSSEAGRETQTRNLADRKADQTRLLL